MTQLFMYKCRIYWRVKTCSQHAGSTETKQKEKHVNNTDSNKLIKSAQYTCTFKKGLSIIK